MLAVQCWNCLYRKRCHLKPVLARMVTRLVNRLLLQQVYRGSWALAVHWAGSKGSHLGPDLYGAWSIPFWNPGSLVPSVFAITLRISPGVHPNATTPHMAFSSYPQWGTESRLGSRGWLHCSESGVTLQAHHHLGYMYTRWYYTLNIQI
jgi:hypothetical protein